MTITPHPSFSVHPGPWLRREIIEPHGLTLTQAAVHLGVTRQALTNLVSGRADLSAEMALRFEKAFGLVADTLVRLQAAHDLARARAGADRLAVTPVPRPAPGGPVSAA
jgi:addiction module HigA family antidote